MGEQVQHQITGCHLCVGLTPISVNAKNLSQYDPAWRTRKPNLDFNCDNLGEVTEGVDTVTGAYKTQLLKHYRELALLKPQLSLLLGKFK